MTSKELQEVIEKQEYRDMLVDNIKVDNFCSSINVRFYSEKWITYSMINCYKVIFNHCIEYPKDLLDLPPCFFRNISVGDIEEDGKKLLVMKIDAYPVELEVWCESIEIDEVQE